MRCKAVQSDLLRNGVLVMNEMPHVVFFSENQAQVMLLFMCLRQQQVFR